MVSKYFMVVQSCFLKWSLLKILLCTFVKFMLAIREISIKSRFTWFLKLERLHSFMVINFKLTWYLNRNFQCKTEALVAWPCGASVAPCWSSDLRCNLINVRIEKFDVFLFPWNLKSVVKDWREEPGGEFKWGTRFSLECLRLRIRLARETLNLHFLLLGAFVLSVLRNDI